MSSVLLIGVLALGFSDDEAANQRRISLEEQQDLETLHEWLTESPPAELKFVSAARYPDATQLIERYVWQKTKSNHKVKAIAFVMESHTPAFIHGRVFRAKFKGKNDKEHTIDFLMQRKTAYFTVSAWMRAKDYAAVAVTENSE